MKQVVLSLLLFCSLLQLTAQEKKKEITYHPNAVNDSSKKSIQAAVLAEIGAATIRINYYSPAVRGRNIWGGLVPYNEVWVTGAHSATNIEISKAILIGGKKVEAGKYALFTIPGKDEWVLIINKNYQQHLSDDYDAKDDLVRITVQPQMNEQPLERLEYFIERKEKNNAVLSIQWEKIKLSVPFTIAE